MHCFLMKCNGHEVFFLQSCTCLLNGRKVACKNSHFSLLFTAGNVSHGGMSVTQWQKFHTDDGNQCLHDKSSSHGVPNVDLFNFMSLLADCCKVL